MRRQLIAFLALLTGLAALGAPAQASITDVINHDFGVSADAETNRACDRVTPASEPEKQVSKCKKMKKRRKAPVPAALRMPVLMGIDRAYE